MMEPCRGLLWGWGMLPDFTEDGLLPPGIYRITWEEFEKRFVYFAHSDRRFRLFDKLRQLYQQAKQSSIVKRLLIGGSYITTKPEPNDFDCILVLDPQVGNRELSPIEYNLLWRSRARRIFGGDIISVAEGSANYDDYMKLFQTTRDKMPVGIVEIV